MGTLCHKPSSIAFLSYSLFIQVFNEQFSVSHIVPGFDDGPKDIRLSPYLLEFTSDLGTHLPLSAGTQTGTLDSTTGVWKEDKHVWSQQAKLPAVVGSEGP